MDLEETQVQLAQTGVALESADTCSLSSVATYTLAMDDPYGADEPPLWAWVSGGGCSVDSHSQLNWFNCSINTSGDILYQSDVLPQKGLACLHFHFILAGKVPSRLEAC